MPLITNPANAVKGFDDEARWFSGKERSIECVVATEELPLPGGGLRFADVSYADGEGERYLLCEDIDWAALLGQLGAGPITGLHGRLELRGTLPTGLLGQRTPAVDQTNTLIVLGGRLLIKLYRRLEPGPHPELEMLAALTGTGAPVPALLGSLHYVGNDGSDTAIAVLEEFVAGAEGGWEGPIERVARHLRGDGEAPVTEYGVAAAAAARLHEASRREFGSRVATAEDAEQLRGRALDQLDRAAVADPTLSSIRSAASAAMEPLGGLAGTSLQRIHGDLHYAQFLRVESAALIIDFEGDPTRPLAERGDVAPPLYDLACLTRAIDHIGSAAARRTRSDDPCAWIDSATEAAIAGYGPVDAGILRALEVCKECGELLYAQRTVPEWLYAPMLGLKRLLEGQVR